jgi:hypothetical protein
VTAAVELPTGTPASAAEDRTVGRVVELASGLLMLLDEHGITGRLPVDARAQASRLRHAVKLAVQTAAARSSGSPPWPLAPASPDPAVQLREWIAAQPWATDWGPVGWVYLLCFRDPTTGQHRPLRGNGAGGQYAGHYWGKPASSGLLKVGWRVAGGEFAELAQLRWPVGVVKWATGASAGQGASLPGRDMALLGQPTNGIGHGLAQLTPLDCKLLTGGRVVHHDLGSDAKDKRHRFRADRQPHRNQPLHPVDQATTTPQQPVRSSPLRQPAAGELAKHPHQVGHLHRRPGQQVAPRPRPERSTAACRAPTSRTSTKARRPRGSTGSRPRRISRMVLGPSPR